MDDDPQVAIAAASVGDDDDDEGDDGVGDDQYTEVSASASGTGGNAYVEAVAQCPIAPDAYTGGPQCTSALLVMLNPADNGFASSSSTNFGGSSAYSKGDFEVQGTTGTNGILKGTMLFESSMSIIGDFTDPLETSMMMQTGSFWITGWMSPDNAFGWVIDVYGPDGYITTLNQGTTASLAFASEEMVTVGDVRGVVTQLDNNRSAADETNILETTSGLSSFVVEETTSAVPATITVDDGSGPVLLWSSAW